SLIRRLAATLLLYTLSLHDALPISEIMAHPDSLTGKYLAGRMEVPVPAKRRQPDPARRIRIIGARGNNLRNITAEIPLGMLVCRSEEHTSELQSRENLVCRLLHEKT